MGNDGTGRLKSALPFTDTCRYVELMVDHNIFTCQAMVEYMIRDGSTFLDEGLARISVDT